MHAFEEVKDRSIRKVFSIRERSCARRSSMTARTSATAPIIAPMRSTTALDWSAYPGAGGGFQGAVEMCNNNGACRALKGGVMCPSYRVTRDERDVTRGRANSLRLAITGQLGPDALTSERDGGDAEALRLLQGMPARMPDRRRHGAHEDRSAAGAGGKIRPVAARPAGRLSAALRALCGATAWLLNLRDIVPGAAKLSEAIAGFSARRSLPKWRPDVFDESDPGHDGGGNREVVLFADTFNRYFERENIDAALAVLNAGGYRVHVATPADGGRPLCCGRTFLSIGKVDEARTEAERTLAALAPFVAQGMPVIGLEPSCLFSFRDEIPALIKSEAARRVAGAALLFEEFLAREAAAGTLDLPLVSSKTTAFLHGHCHQKSFDTMTAVERTLKLIPDLEVETIESSCCGMAGAFGYHADTIDVSRAMGELSLLPAVRKAPDDAMIVADGTSCRHQIHDGSGREAIHVARVLGHGVAA